MKLLRAARYTLALPPGPDGRAGGTATYVRGETLARAHRALVPEADRALFSGRAAARRAAPPVPAAPTPDADHR